MKQCKDCKEFKLLDQFYHLRDGKGIWYYQARCKKCFALFRKDYVKEYNLKNANILRDKRLEKQNKNRKIVAKIKENNPCQDCGKFYPYYCMDFDHKGNKKNKISKMLNYSIKTILKEIEKCDLLCVMCHRNRTFFKKQHNSIPTKNLSTKEQLNKKRYIERNRKIVLLAKDHPCKRCGGNFNPWQMDFDHLPEFNKRRVIAHLKNSPCGEEILKTEINKCDLLCALCHRIVSFERQFKQNYP